jgi:hypothetical protein
VENPGEPGLAHRSVVVCGRICDVGCSDKLYITHRLGAHGGASEAVGAPDEASLEELRQRGGDAFLLHVALDLPRLYPAGRGDVREDCALARRQGMSVDLGGR